MSLVDYSSCSFGGPQSESCISGAKGTSYKFIGIRDNGDTACKPSRRFVRRRRAHSYTRLSPGKARPRSESSSRSRSTSRSKSSSSAGYFTSTRRPHHTRPNYRRGNLYHNDNSDRLFYSKGRHDDETVSPRGICVFIPPSAVSSLSGSRSRSRSRSRKASKFCLGNGSSLFCDKRPKRNENSSLIALEKIREKLRLSFGIKRDSLMVNTEKVSENKNASDSITIPTGLPSTTTREEDKDDTSDVMNEESFMSHNQNKMFTKIDKGQKFKNIALHNTASSGKDAAEFPFSSVSTLISNEEDKNYHDRGDNSSLSICADGYRTSLCENDWLVQENINTNSGLSSAHRKRLNKQKKQTRSSNQMDDKPDVSSENENPADPSSTYLCKRHKEKRRGPNSVRDGDIDLDRGKERQQRRHQSQETKEFCKKMASTFEPNEIAVGVEKKSRAIGTTKECAKCPKHDLRQKNPDTNSQSCNCRNNSSFISYNKTNIGTNSSRRCRSMSERKLAFGRMVSPRGISIGASSSEEASGHRHRQMGGGSRQRGRSKSPAARRPGQAAPRSGSLDRRSSGGSSRSATKDSRSRSKSPASKGAQSRRGGPNSPRGPTTSGVTNIKGDKKKTDASKAKGSASTTEGIVPLTPAEICERCNKYRIDKEIGDCVPLDFSHVQQLEKLAETVSEESTRQLLKTVTAIIEEKVCKQMFRCLMPCGCPGCKDRPGICESLDKFLGSSGGGKDKRRPSSKGKSGKEGAKGGKNKSSPKSGKQKASGESPKRGKSKGGAKGKEGKEDKAKKSASEKSDAGDGECCPVPSMSCCRTPPGCYYDRDCCCGRYGCSHRPWSGGGGWSSSSMRLGWWPGTRSRCSVFDRCWNNRNSEFQGKDDAADRFADKKNETWPSQHENQNGVQGRDVNAACSSNRDREWEDTEQGHSGDKCKYRCGGSPVKGQGRWAAVSSQESGLTGSWVSNSVKTMSDLFRRYGTDSTVPCPHEGISLSRNFNHYRSTITPSSFSTATSIREHVLAQPRPVEKQMKSWGSSLVFGDKDSASRLAAFEKDLSQKSDGSDVERHSEKEKNEIESQGESTGCHTPKSLRGSPRKTRAKKKMTRSRQTSPTSAAIGELEARTKALLSEAKVGHEEPDDQYSVSNQPVGRDGEDSSALLLGFSPIRPPDVNTAYSVIQAAEGRTEAGNFSENTHCPQGAAANPNKQWWDGLPQKTTRTFNPLMLKKYTSNSAMPVSVQPVNQGAGYGVGSSGKAQAGGGSSGSVGAIRSSTRQPAGIHGRSRSEPRLPQTVRRKGDRTPQSGADSSHPDVARKTGSYTVCKGRPGKQGAKRKSAKKLWKY